MAQFPLKNGLLQGTLDGTPSGGTVDLSALTLTLPAANRSPMLIYRHTATDGSHGGTATSGSWQTRTINEETVDTNSIGSLSSNQITLPAGTYRLRAECSFYAVGYIQTRLYNATDSTVIAYGHNGYNASGQTYPIPLECRFTIASSKAIRVEYRCTATSATYGQGEASTWSGNEEVYATVVIIKE